MREAVPGTASAVADPGVFSIGQHMENNLVSPTAADVSKICQDMNDLQVRFNKITSADFRSKSSKSWKPEVTPPRRRGGFNRGRGGRQFDTVQSNDRFKISESNSNQDRDNGEPRTFPVDNHIPFDGRGMLKAYLSNGTPMKLFFDSGASRSYLSKRFYDSNPVLHDMPKFVTTCTGIRIGNGSIVPALFVIPILFMTCGHTFEIFTIIAEIDDDMDLVFGFKNMVETKGMLNTRTGEYDFIGRSIPIFPQHDLDVPAGEKAYIKVKAPFCDKLSGMICTKFFGRDMVYTLRVKFQDNQGVVQFRNGSNETAQLRKNKAVGIPDLRSIGYFKVGYQKMVNMAESGKTFKMYHYKQIKCEAKTEDWPTSDQYMRVTGRYGNEKV